MGKIIQFPGIYQEYKENEFKQKQTASEPRKSIKITDTLLENNNCIITLDNEKSVSGRDLTDGYNLPSFYNQTYKSLKKAWKALKEEFDENTTMREAMKILQQNNVRCKSYCAMD